MNIPFIKRARAARLRRQKRQRYKQSRLRAQREQLLARIEADLSRLGQIEDELVLPENEDERKVEKR